MPNWLRSSEVTEPGFYACRPYWRLIGRAAVVPVSRGLGATLFAQVKGEWYALHDLPNYRFYGPIPLDSHEQGQGDQSSCMDARETT